MKVRTLVIAACAALATLAATSTAQAGDRDRYRGGYERHHWRPHHAPHWRPYGVYYPPPRVYYAPPPVYYAPRPYAYAPPTLYFGFGVR
ncbi:MAG: hypothetical protein IT555_09090 [Acetobacteraceae bacterium]|nr:hypothetical protein [Acetobacteraceae bacterium]